MQRGGLATEIVGYDVTAFDARHCVGKQHGAHIPSCNGALENFHVPSKVQAFPQVDCSAVSPFNGNAIGRHRLIESTMQRIKSTVWERHKHAGTQYISWICVHSHQLPTILDRHSWQCAERNRELGIVEYECVVAPPTPRPRHVPNDSIGKHHCLELQSMNTIFAVVDFLLKVNWPRCG